MSLRITIDGHETEVADGQTLLHAARKLGIEIPTLCYLEKCGPLNTCQVCLVKVIANGKSGLVPSCGTRVTPGMIVESDTEEVHEARRTALELLFSDHVGDCLSPCHRLCPLQLNIPLMIRQIEARHQEEAIRSVRRALPLAGVLGRLCHHPCEQGCRRGHWDHPAAIRDMERFVTDVDSEASEPFVPPLKSSTGHRILIIGAGPTGLAAAYHLAQQGHAITVADRNPRVGGSLRKVPGEELPPPVLEREAAVLMKMGIDFKLGAELGNHIRLEGLLRSYEAILLAVGGVTSEDAGKLGVAVGDSNIKVNANTCQTSVPRVFAAGAAVKPLKQLVRAMAEGRAAAECVHRFASGQPVRRPEKPFSSIMGRLDPAELREFLRTASGVERVSPCDRCAGLTRIEADTESARCLHCDCRSSGNCALQHHAQVYGADANRFRSERRPFEQQRQQQPGGVIFEPGKCILCGICVEIARRAAEPLGLTFVGRGFDVRVGAPMGSEFSSGLQKVARECIECCPTGALSLSEGKGRELSS